MSIVTSYILKLKVMLLIPITHWHERDQGKFSISVCTTEEEKKNL